MYHSVRRPGTLAWWLIVRRAMSTMAKMAGRGHKLDLVAAAPQIQVHTIYYQFDTSLINWF